MSLDLQFVKTNAKNKDFKALAQKLDHEMWLRYGPHQEKYNGLNYLKEEAKVILIKFEQKLIGCGAFRALEDGKTIELKRVYVRPEYRGLGISKMLLQRLENWALQQGYRYAILETGNRQPEALGLYRNSGYVPIDRYNPYTQITESICMRKELPTNEEKV